MDRTLQDAQSNLSVTMTDCDPIVFLLHDDVLSTRVAN